ncbi:aminoacylase-1-like [Drosophila bipectinata]|uniref:aminoacylase-1-like n=1 Tax=Drosophila bipectinata TaxID=42026 RepID=UPI001C8A5429|nr:aminoacylase-1-like [Drosophila bipectinata]
MSTNIWESNEEIQFFREYLRIPSVHPNPDYEPCVEFLKSQASGLDLPIKICHPANEKNPVVVLTWEGLQPDLPSVLLNSHMDVVPVFPEKWSHPPFGAEIDEEGRIFARGSQDMKCVGMQYLAAIRALKRSGARFKRTIHISFVPDEEVGGKLGMFAFVTSPEFRSLNVGFSLDEGIASPSSEFPVFFAERSVRRVIFKIGGSAGHGLLLMPNTAGEKLSYILERMMEFRSTQVRRLKDNPELQIGDVTTINLTTVTGGVQSNVVPPLLTVCFDCRLSMDIDISEFHSTLLKWSEEAGGDIEVEFGTTQSTGRVPPTATNDSNPFWVAFKKATDDLGLSIKLQVFPGGTDSRYIRNVGIPALGFSPMNNTPVLLHDHDEYLHAETYLNGVETYIKIIGNVANA